MQKENWFEKAFEKNYLTVYAHRDQDQAIQEVEFISEKLSLHKSDVLLDLCCGAGRHSFALASKVKMVYAYDLSSDLLLEGIANTKNIGKEKAIVWVKGDMRQMTYQNVFSVVVCLFNSFGYFYNECENENVLNLIFKSLMPKGRFLLEIMNESYIQSNLIPFSEKRKGDFLIRESRLINKESSRIEKKVVILKGEEIVSDYVESVRIYSFVEITSLLEKVGFVDISCYGSYTGSPFDEKSSKLLILANKQ